MALAGSVPDSGGQSGIPALPCQARRRRLHRRPQCHTSWQGENAENAAHTDFALLAVDGIAERSDVRPSATRSPQQLGSAQRRSFGVILFFNAIPTALLAHMFAQQLPGLGIEQADIQLIPLHAQQAADPARRRAVVSGFAFAGSLSGALNAPHDLGDKRPEFRNQLLKVFGPPASAVRAENNVFSMLQSAGPRDLPYFYLACGSADDFLQVNRDFAAQLSTRGAAYEYHETVGGHAWDYWDRSVQDLLRAAASVVSKP